MKKILLLLLLLPVFGFAQDFKLLKKTNDIEVYYKITKIEENEKNTKYLLEVSCKNVSDKDMFYAGIPAQGKYDSPVNNFLIINMPNTTGAFSFSSTSITGEKSNLSTNGSPIFIVKSKKEYTESIEIKVKKETEPIITAELNSKITFKNNISDYL